MIVDMPTDLVDFVEREFATGRYSSKQDVLVQALRWLKEQRERSLAGIQEGLADAAAGRVQPLHDAMNDLRHE